MTGPAVTQDSATTSSATDLESSLGALFGDYTESGESPEPETTSAAGTTPAEPAAGTEPDAGNAPAPDGDAAATAASDGTTPDTPTASAADDQDPFADTTPATFMVNGQPVTTEDIRVFKEGGAVIRPEALPNVLQRLSERESLQSRNHEQSQQYQVLAKATEWTDPSGKTYTGPEAAVELRVGNASMFAENQLIVSVLTDPDQLERCLTTVMVPDGKGGQRERVVFSEDALDSLRIRNENAQMKIAQAIRDHYRGVISDASKPQPAPLDYATETPKLVTQLATAAQLDASVLTAEDKQLLAEQLPFHVKDGNASIAWQNLAKRMMTQRAAEKANAAKLVSTTQDATKTGLANMAAAARGLKPAARPVAPAPRPVSPHAQRAETEGDLYDLQERAAAAALRNAR